MITSLVMMALGAFRFGMRNESYQQLERQTSYRWEGLNRVGRAPLMQYLGPGEDVITLSGTIHPHYRGGLHQVELMRAQAHLGIPMMLTSGMGVIFKRWAITEVSETKTYFMADGAPRQIDFTLTLKAAGGLL